MSVILFKLYLWWYVPGFTLNDALRYPYDPFDEECGPFELAREEISEMRE